MERIEQYRTAALFFNDVLGRSLADIGYDPNQESSAAAIEHASKVLAKFIRKANQRFDAQPERIIGENVYFTDGAGDIALFRTSVFPETLDRTGMKFYIGMAMTVYSDMFGMSGHPAYGELADHFERYRRCINLARNRYMHFAEPKEGPVRIMSPQNLHGLLNRDGTIKWLN